MVDFGYFLAQKYALLQQQADAQTQNAATQAIGTRAAANLDNARAAVTPAESQAQIKLQGAQGNLYGAQSSLAGAQANLTGEQAKVVAPEAAANIGLTRAQTGLVGSQKRGLDLNNIIQPPVAPTLAGVFANQGLPTFRLSDPLPARRLRESDAAYLDRVNGL